MRNPKDYLRRRQAADYLRNKFGCGSLSSLNNYARDGVGPKFILWGRIPLYSESDLDKWAESRFVEPSVRHMALPVAAE